ncbi:hypothetical protein [Labrys neptuniae]
MRLLPFTVTPLPGLANIPAPTLETLLGQVTVLNIWASWCRGSQEEHDLLLGLRSRGTRLAGIDLFDRNEAALDYLERKGNPFVLVGVDDKRDFTAKLAIRSIPQSFLIGPAAQVLWRFEESLNQALARDLLERIEALKT